MPSNDLNYRSVSSVFFYTIFGHFLRMEVNKLKLWISCYYVVDCRWSLVGLVFGKNRNALAHGRFAYLKHDLVSFERKLMDLNSMASSKSWKRKQQLVWYDENVAACGCGKENAQWNTKNNIRCGSPHSLPSNFIVADFHVRLCLLPSLSLLFIYHISVTFRNSAERRGLTSLCPKSFVLCASLFQG